MNREKEDYRRRLAAMAFVLDYDPGGPQSPWPAFVDALAGKGGDRRRFQAWLFGLSVPSARTKARAAEQLRRLCDERSVTFNPDWLHERPEKIVASAGRSVDDFQRALDRSMAAPPSLISSPYRPLSAEHARYSASRYYCAFHVFRFDETTEANILHGVLVIGPDEFYAPGVARTAYVERYLAYRGFAFPAKDEIAATLRASDPTAPGCMFLIERHKPSENAFAGVFLGLAHKRQVPAATRCILIRMAGGNVLTADDNDSAIEAVCQPKALTPTHPDYERLAALLQQPKKRADTNLSAHALWIKGDQVGEQLKDFRPFAAGKTAWDTDRTG